ncbi:MULTISPECIES: metal ABC transporter solute-binding protein, Zn/Mn family [Tatumella]|uniref:Metal ABC transporter solute-binding protein, Zn/Mn family n=1 Tax=Tatumella punctata TaxID=399969 RepID=A0ABW1VNI5_9GAMM|nr:MULTISPECIES: zinc ABC transporter substrate-binding protein [unclassified Tatumella]MBS0854501.1 zinc ABC transporter substrate-binding protein [Tatumella sp. JGM16]MBS0893775.1 zinc ABC transporter substrate-binding protein [Tatumella sp. JGM130]MBS0911205.1 zinc ABC transporter substrate-binding protein [Tatumella sp. JGM91]
MKKLIPALLACCAVFTPAAMAGTVHVVASFTVLADMVRQIGGQYVEVKSLVGPDGDPHTFEPAPQDSVALAKADVVVISGLGLEGWMERLIRASGYQGKVIVASQGITPLTMTENGNKVTDPHAWNSMANGVIYARNISQSLQQADPQDAAEIRRQGDAYIRQLESLDHWAQSKFAAIPASKRLVLTSHDAFGYFGDRYGVKFVSPIGFNTDEEASASGVAALINQLKSTGIHRYFIENQTDPRLVQQIAAAADATPGGELYPEALSDERGPAATYQQAFRLNVDQLLKSMQ